MLRTSPFGKCTFEIKPQRVKLHFIRTTMNKCTVWISGIFPQPFRFVLKRMRTFYIVILERNSISSSPSHTPPPPLHADIHNNTHTPKKQTKKQQKTTTTTTTNKQKTTTTTQTHKKQLKKTKQKNHTQKNTRHKQQNPRLLRSYGSRKTCLKPSRIKYKHKHIYTASFYKW